MPLTEHNAMETEFFKFFEVFPNSAEYESYLTLRYQVFCAELERISEFTINENNRHIETDKFDSHSKHWIAVHRNTGVPAACCRLILPSSDGLSLFRRYAVTEWPFPEVEEGHIAEISRMAIASDFRRRQSDKGKPVAGDPNNEIPSIARSETDHRRRHQPELVLGMYREIFRYAGEAGITHAYAAMAPYYIRLLLMAGFPFIAVGPTNPQVTPPRRPYVVSRDQIVQQFKKKNPEILAFLMGG